MMEGARGTIEAVAIKNLQEVLRKKGISAEALFSKYDLDGNGSLSENEFAGALESITGQQAPATILRAVFGALDTNSDGSVDLPEILAMMEGGSTESVPAGRGVSISDHPNESYNGGYDLQDIQINGKALYKSAGGNRLYFYNANSGGAPSWSLDDREQDGSNDWYRGGWSRPRGDGSLPTGTRRWVGVGKITISIVGKSSESTTDDTASRAAENSSGDEQIKITLPRSSFKSGEEISFSFTAFELPNDAWIGIVPAEIPHGDEAVNDQHDTSFKYLEGRTHGGFTLPNPGLGEWTLRLHDTDNNGRELAYVPFAVATDETPSSPPDFDTGKSELDMVTDNFTELISKLERSVSDQGLSVEQAREIADSEVEKEIEKLPFSLQSSARRIWRIRANSMQEQIVSRMPSPEAIAAGAAAVGVAGVVAADMQENAEEAPVEGAPPEPTRSEDMRRRANDVGYASHDEWHEEHHIDIPDQVEIPDQVDVRERGGSQTWHDSHRVTSSDRVSVPDRVEVGTRRRPPPSRRRMEAPEVAARVAAPVADANVPAVSVDLSDLSTAFSEARMLSDQRRLADSVEGQSQNISMKVTTAPERTFGIGVDDAYRGGSTVIAEIPGVGEVEIRLRNDADSSLFQSGSEHSLDTSFTGWNGIRKRLILSAQ